MKGLDLIEQDKFAWSDGVALLKRMHDRCLHLVSNYSGNFPQTQVYFLTRLP